MPLLRRQFTIWHLMMGVAVLAVVCRFGESVVRHPSPRTCLPPLMILYLMWACCDGLRIICAAPIWSRPSRLLAFSGLVLLFVAGTAAENRWADLRERSLSHARQAFLCRLSAEGRHGEIIGCGGGVCVRDQVPRADSQEERAEMLRLADHHARLAKYYQARW
jgi:hypothetical protein